MKNNLFFNLELAKFKHLSDKSFESMNKEKNYEEKEMNPEELYIYFQNKKNINILNPNQKNKTQGKEHYHIMQNKGVFYH